MALSDTNNYESLGIQHTGPYLWYIITENKEVGQISAFFLFTRIDKVSNFIFFTVSVRVKRTLETGIGAILHCYLHAPICVYICIRKNRTCLNYGICLICTVRHSLENANFSQYHRNCYFECVRESVRERKKCEKTKLEAFFHIQYTTRATLV